MHPGAIDVIWPLDLPDFVISVVSLVLLSVVPPLVDLNLLGLSQMAMALE